MAKRGGLIYTYRFTLIGMALIVVVLLLGFFSVEILMSDVNTEYFELRHQLLKNEPLQAEIAYPVCPPGLIPYGSEDGLCCAGKVAPDGSKCDGQICTTGDLADQFKYPTCAEVSKGYLEFKGDAVDSETRRCKLTWKLVKERGGLPQLMRVRLPHSWTFIYLTEVLGIVEGESIGKYRRQKLVVQPMSAISLRWTVEVYGELHNCYVMFRTKLPESRGPEYMTVAFNNELTVAPFTGSQSQRFQLVFPSLTDVRKPTGGYIRGMNGYFMEMFPEPTSNYTVKMVRPEEFHPDVLPTSWE